MLFIVMFASTSLGNAALLVFMAQLLPHKLSAWKIALIAPAYSLMLIPKIIINFDASRMLPINIIGLLLLLLIPTLMFKGHLVKRFAVFAMIMIMMFLSDVVATQIVLTRYGDMAAIFSEAAATLTYNAIAMSLFILLGSAAVIIMRVISLRRFQPFFLLFFVLPIGQVAICYSYYFDASSYLWLFGMLLSLAADLVLLAYTVSLEKKTETEEELRETRHQMALEQFHYREVEQRREELSKIRHDFNNQLAAVARLVHDGENASARDIITSLSTEINSTKENAYCLIPVINAILTEKVTACETLGIETEIELDIPEQLSVEPMHLCSVFSNLLDNAAAACSLVAERGTPRIQLSSKLDGDYLFIKVVNPSAAPPASPRAGRGYGRRILSDMASRYSGSFYGEYADGAYTTVISLLATQTRNSDV